jgi:sulfite dehydrogenase
MGWERSHAAYRPECKYGTGSAIFFGSAAGITLSFLISGCSRDPRFDDEALARFPEKTALRLLNDRAPQLETPWRYFRQELTPTDALFVRWHLQPIPTRVDLAQWKLRVGGHVRTPVDLTMDDLRAMPAREMIAVIQCSGNSRRFFEPRVSGGQWGDGAMGNVRWKGVRLADVLERTGIRAGARQVTFNGLDTGPLPATPDFVKALDFDHAMQPEILLAYEMNGEELPMLNGFPLRLVVPGWYATYWVKSLAEIKVLDSVYDGFWMAKAYQIPNNADASERPGDLSADTVPINRFNTRSFWVHPSEKTGDTVFPDNGTVQLEEWPSTAAAGSHRSSIRPTTGQAGMKRAWARTGATMPSAAGMPSGHRALPEPTF